MNKTLVTGATGKQGGAVAHLLLDQGRSVRAMTRHPDSPAARALAERGAVLLKDRSRALPIAASIHSIAVIGTPADATPISSGGGSSHVAVPYVVTPLAGIEAREPGTIVYAVHRVDGQPLQRLHYELYRDRAAFEAHEAAPHTRRYLAARDALLASAEVDWLTLQAGTGTGG